MSYSQGKNRLYPAYSVSSSETDDSPVHNNNKNTKGLQYLASSSSHQYTLPYKPILQQHHQQQQQQQQQLSSGIASNAATSDAAIGLNQLTPSSDNASDATLTDAESTVLARKNNSSLIHNDAEAENADTLNETQANAVSDDSPLSETAAIEEQTSPASDVDESTTQIKSQVPLIDAINEKQLNSSIDSRRHHLNQRQLPAIDVEHNIPVSFIHDTNKQGHFVAYP